MEYLIIRYPRGIIAGNLVLLFLFSLGVKNLKFSDDYRDFFDKDDPYLAAFKNLGKKFTFTDNVLIVLAPKSQNIFSAKTLELVQELTETSALIPFQTHTDSLANYLHVVAEGDRIKVEIPFGNLSSLNAKDVQHGKEKILSNRYLFHRLISPTGDVTAINVHLFFPKKKEGELAEAAMFVNQLAKKIREENPDMNVHLGGSVFFSAAFKETAQKDLAQIFPAMYVLIVIVLYLVLRSFLLVWGVFLVIVFSDLTALGLAGWFGISLSALSAQAPTVIITLAVADCIHISTTFSQKLREGFSKNDAIVVSLQENRYPIFLTSVITALGFLCLNFNSAVPFRDFGNITALGVISAYFFSVTFFPATLAIFPLNTMKMDARKNDWMKLFGEFVCRNSQMILWGMFILILALVLQIPKNTWDERVTEFFDSDTEFRKDMDFITNHFSGILNVDYAFETGQPRGILDPPFLNHLDTFSSWYQKQEGVVFVNTFSDTIKGLNRLMHEDDDGYFQIPDNHLQSAQFYLFYQMGLPVGYDLDTWVRPDDSGTLFSVLLGNLSTREILKLEQDAREWLEDSGSTLWRPLGVSPSVLFAHLAKNNIYKMIGGTVVALSLVSLILLTCFRSVKIGIISLVPNLIPAAMAFGFWGLFFTKIGLALSAICVMSLGIVVNDTVHFLAKYLKARRENGSNAKDAIKSTFSSVGPALWSTSLILVCGFSILAFSSFSVNSDMGILTALAIVFALITDFLLLPTLLIKFDS